MSTKDDLAALPGLYDACEVVLGGGGGRRLLDERVRGGQSRGLNLHEGALRVRSRMLAVLASWSGMVTSERGVSAPRRREVPVLVAFLSAHADWLAGHPAAADFAEEIGGIAADARRVSSADSGVRQDLGKCSRPACGRPVWATLRGGGPVSARCEAGHDWPTHQWLLLVGAA
ncbi:hypothetical protein FKR81_20400 [Lentzea tibetensis]|uniref:Uncharacterized protein n=1 Tax=Lentzea tibetensis TaxID=2591470 RepID=A0A563ESF2_9PSEU|nr:hypothetical protein [Lentzea tibetensis]TWP50532.1 hypothetical protein FKR81_20400 [Lentzea tibetensis]